MYRLLNWIVGWGKTLAVASALAASLTATSAVAQTAPDRFPITPQHVVAGMTGLHLPVEGVQVKIATAMTASVKEPMVSVTSMSLLSEHSARMRMACVNRGECLPFYVVAVWPEQTPAIIVPARIDGNNRGSKAETKSKEAVSVTAQVSDSIAKKAEKEQPALRAGMSSTMVIEGGRIHIRLKVVCLQSGATGDKVRVATPDHKQAYVAEIVTPMLLKGIL